MPGDRLALTVGVGGEIEVVRAPERLADGADVLLGTVGDGPVMAKASSGRTEPSLGRRSRTWP